MCSRSCFDESFWEALTVQSALQLYVRVHLRTRHMFTGGRMKDGWLLMDDAAAEYFPLESDDVETSFLFYSSTTLIGTCGVP